jgi:ribosomal protein S18 acetylase RimI-like enzyme
MNSLSFNPITPDDYDIVERMILDFYSEGRDPSDEPFMTDSKIRKTIAQTLSHPDHLKILVFHDNRSADIQGEPIGYCILTAFWSNEYGGLVTILDELYVIPAFRNKGIATRFICHLADAKDYVAIQLECFPENTGAFNLYRRLGFEVIDRHFMHKPLN